MRMRTRVGAIAVALTAAAAGGSVVVGPALAAQSTMTITCGGTDYTIRTNNNHSSDNGGWSVAQIVDSSGHFIPVTFSGTLVDTTQNNAQVGPGFTSEKGNGNANQNQTTTTCSFVAFSGPASDFASDPSSPPLPSWVKPTDTLTLTFTVTAVKQ